MDRFIDDGQLPAYRIGDRGELMIAATSALGIIVAASFVVAGIEDARTTRVTIRRSKSITIVAVVGLLVISAVGGTWDRLLSAVLGAVLVSSVQIMPYWWQSRRRDDDWIGKADVRLGVPFGWTVGWFGLGLAVASFALALLLGLGYALATRRSSVPFVPFLAAGVVVGVGWGIMDVARSGI